MATFDIVAGATGQVLLQDTNLDLLPRADIGAQRRQLTVVMCDLVGATALSSRLDPEDYRDLMLSYQEACKPIVSAYGGFIAQYHGDGILIYFGYPIALENAAERAISAAMELSVTVPQIETSLPDCRLQVHVGIATGVVVVGDALGEGASEQIAAIGQAPNLASRISQVAAPSTVLISDSTRYLVGALFEYEEMGLHTLDGIAHPVSIWRVLRARVQATRFESLRWSHGVRVFGRDRELAELKSVWDGVAEGRGRAVVVTGEAGIGKSAFLRYLSRELVSDDSFRVTMQCSELHAATPFHPLASHLQAAAGIIAADTIAERLTKLRLLADPERQEEELALMAALSRVEDDALISLDFTPQQRKVAILRMAIGQILRLSKLKPVLLLVEDVHWIDPSTRDLANALFDGIATAPVMVIASARREAEAGWASHKRVHLLRLAPLDAPSIVALIRQTNGGDPLPAPIESLIVERSDGIALFAEELTKMVIELGAQAAPTPDWLRKVLQGGNQRVPAALRDILAARLDSVGGAREVAQIGAVIGRDLPSEWLRAVCDLPEPELNRQLQRLMNAGLFMRHGSGRQSGEFSFSHALVKDVAYESILRARCRHYHERLANYLVARRETGRVIDAGTIAHHLGRAGQPEGAARHYLLGGQAAFKQFANLEAIQHARQALMLLEPLRGNGAVSKLEFDLQMLRAQASYALAGPAAEETIEAYNRAQELVSQFDNIEQQCALLYGIFASYHFAARFELALRPARAALELAERENDPWVRCQGHRMLGYVHFFRGECLTGRAHFAALAANYDAETFGPLAPRFGADCLVGATGFDMLIECLCGAPRAARARCVANLAYAQRLGHPASLGWAYASACYLAFFLRDPDWALELGTAGIEHCCRHDVGAWRVHCAVFATWACATKSETENATREIEQLIEEAARGTALGIPMLRAVLIDLHMRAGHWSEARAVAERSLGEIRQTEQYFFEPVVLAAIACCVAKDPAIDEATTMALFDAAFASARTRGMELMELRILQSLLDYERAIGSDHGALGALQALLINASPEVREASQAQ